MFEVECGAGVRFSGEENIAVYRATARAERGFCRICGTHLFMKALPAGEYGISPGLFTDSGDLQFNRQVFIDQKPDYYSFVEQTIDIDSAYIHEHYPETRDSDH